MQNDNLSDEEYQKVKNDMISFLKDNFVMEIATVRDNKPAVTPVIYVIDDDLNFYFVTYRTSVKAQNLINNPVCSFTIWQFSQICIQADGIASIVEDEKRKEWVIDAFADAATKDSNFWAPIFRIKRGDYCLFQIKPTWMRVLDLSHNTIRQENSPYTEIKL